MPVNEWLPSGQLVNASAHLGMIRKGTPEGYRRCSVVNGFLFTGVLRMKSRESLVRLKQFQVTEKSRQLNQIQLMMAEMQKMAAELEYQIVAEEKKAGINDPSHFAYPTFAKAARQRADNLSNSIRELQVQLDAAEIALEEAQAEHAKAAALEERDNKSSRAG
tara:strand:- start:4 stop:492 length:489 start_codon:yes stop_codon:yes gene_type:complete